MKAKVGTYDTQEVKMKRHGNLFSKIVDKENIKLAHMNARKGKTFYKEVKDIDANIDKYVDEIHNMLVENTYQVSEYKMFKKNDKGKIREIYKLDYYPDRIIHHAILQILEPIWKPMLIKNTYQSIKGRGVKLCKRDVHKCIKANMDKEIWVLKADIQKFYPSVDNNILKTIVSKKIKCKETLNLLYIIIDSMKGLPIGNYISQYLGNIYLMYFDYFVKSNSSVLGYFRYCDDIVVISESKDSVKLISSLVNNYLVDKLNLKVKSNVQYFKLKHRALDFVGFRFYWEGSLKLRNSIIKKMVVILRLNRIKSIAAYFGWVLEARCFSAWNKFYLGERYGSKRSYRR